MKEEKLNLPENKLNLPKEKFLCFLDCFINVKNSLLSFATNDDCADYKYMKERFSDFKVELDSFKQEINAIKKNSNIGCLKPMIDFYKNALGFYQSMRGMDYDEFGLMNDEATEVFKSLATDLEINIDDLMGEEHDDRNYSGYSLKCKTYEKCLEIYFKQ